VETVLHAIVRKNEHTRRHQRLETRLVIRQSCGTRLPSERPPPT